MTLSDLPVVEIDFGVDAQAPNDSCNRVQDISTILPLFHGAFCLGSVAICIAIETTF